MVGTFAVLVAALGFSASAFASSPHFISGGATINQNGSLTCSFKIAGLGNQPQDVTCTATGTFVYQCFNNGGNHPKAGNKETVSDQLSTTKQFQPHNGQITGSLLLGPSGPGAFSCPNGQTLYLESAQYSSIELTSPGLTPLNLGDTGTVTLHQQV
jgi:hypothetical protein